MDEQDAFTALRLAVANKKPELVELLLRHGVDPNSRAFAAGDGTLHMACFWREPCLDTVRVLLEYGADPNRMTPAGYTPLHLALRWGIVNEEHILKLVKLLVEFGADLHIRRRTGGTALHRVSFKMQERILAIEATVVAAKAAKGIAEPST